MIELRPTLRRAVACPEASPWLVRTSLLVLFVALDLVYARYNGLGSDWSPLWAAGRLATTSASSIYDFDLVSALQHPLIGDSGQRPFVYPPTALLIAVPAALLPFWWSYLLYVISALTLLVRASRPWAADPLLVISCLPLFAAAFSGQFTLLVLALILFGLARLDERPGLAGLLLGLAAALKPQLLVLAPVALVAGGYWRTIVVAAFTGAALVAATTLAFGMDVWWQWLAALPRFNALFAGAEPLLRNSLSPTAAAIRNGVDPLAVTIAAVGITVPAAFVVFRRSRDLSLRLVALLGGALILSPYAMNYELAALAPVVLSPRFRGLAALVIPALWAMSIVAGMSLGGLLLVYLLLGSVALKPLWRAIDQLRVKRRIDVAPGNQHDHVLACGQLAGEHGG